MHSIIFSIGFNGREDMYSLIRPLLFLLDPEQAHAVSLNLLKFIPRFCFPQPTNAPLDLMGLSFSHRVGLAAGLDKNGEYLDALDKLGFAFIEIGTVTPRPQSGNPKQRLFRLPEAQALINRMGFNNKGVDNLVKNVKRSSYQGILGINIGKNKDTPLQQAADDYVYCLQQVYPYASYVTVNISSPNTPDLRQLHQAKYFESLIQQIQNARQALQDRYGRHVPLIVKLSPDEPESTLKYMADILIRYQIEGVITTNTTCDKQRIKHLMHGEEVGGLSGAPLFERSTAVLRLLKDHAGNQLIFIGSGGIHDATAMTAKFEAGADLVQLYTGLIYQGPALIGQQV